jgi:hypothetical protein
MLLYVNRTQYPAIVTLNVTDVANTNEAIQVGPSKTSAKLAAEKGVVDLLVAPGYSVVPLEGTVASVIGIRNCP